MKLKKSLPLFLLGAAVSASSADAANGTWIDTTGGLWSDIGNWSGTIANGSGFNANFSILDIIADTTVSSLDGH